MRCKDCIYNQGSYHSKLDCEVLGYIYISKILESERRGDYCQDYFKTINKKVLDNSLKS